MLAHNGEINTLRGNRNWMRARELQLASPLFGDDIEKIRPLLRDDISDSASLDGLMELLVLGGRSPAHAISMLIPRRTGPPRAAEEVRDFYAYHSSLVEPWDGPAAVAFSDGRVIGATLDRNGLRPGRWLVTKDGWVVFASETGVIEVPADRSSRRAAPARQAVPGRPRARRVVPDTEIKRELAARAALRQVARRARRPHRGPPGEDPARAARRAAAPKQLAFGWTEEDLRVTLVPMARDAAEPTGSMGNDTALAVMSDMRPPLFSYFKQLFAQVTNPAIDPIRESIVMSLEAVIGPEINLLGETPDHCHQLVMPQPLLRSTELEKLRQVDHSVFEARTIDMTWPASEGAQGMERRLEEMCAGGVRARRARREHHHPLRPQPRRGARRHAGAARHRRGPPPPRPRGHPAPERPHRRDRPGEGDPPRGLPDRLRRVGGEPVRDVRVALRAPPRGPAARGDGPDEAVARTIKAIGKGLLKILSKMGISTIRSYTGAQIFEAVGLEKELVDRHFTGTPSRVGGVGMNVLAWECLDRHARLPGGEL